MHGTAATMIPGGPVTRPLSARGMSRLLVTVETRQARGSSVFAGRIKNGFAGDYSRWASSPQTILRSINQ